MPATLTPYVELTKQDEIDLYRQFVAGLPRGSYLEAILKDSAGMIAQQIRNDFALPLAGELRATQLQAMEAADELRETRKQLEAARQQLRDIERQHARYVEAISAIRSDAQKLARI